MGVLLLTGSSALVPAESRAQAPVAAPSADAAVAGAASEGDVASVEGAGEPPEIVVTVDRRTKNLQDYSGTASAFSESQLSSIGIENVKDLSVMVPGLAIGTQE